MCVTFPARLTGSHYRIVGPLTEGDGHEIVEARRADDDGGTRPCVLAWLDDATQLSHDDLQRLEKGADGVEVVDFGTLDGRTFVALDVATETIERKDIVSISRELSAIVTPTPRIHAMSTDIEPLKPLTAEVPRRLSELMNVELLLDRSSGDASVYSLPPAGPTVKTAVAAADPMIGQLVRAHRIESRIGEGSFGTVYRARHVTDGTDCAIKILRHTQMRREVYDRFKREALAMSRLTHPNLVRLQKAGRVDGRPFVIMEFVPGRTLRDVVRNETLSLERVHHITRQIAAGLAAAHDVGCIHRDLKPLNVMLVDEHGLDHVKILDFGMVRLLDPTDSVTQITRTNMMIGTPRWSAPEQITDPHRIDPRADLYSLGLLMHYMVAGVRTVSGALPQVLGQRLLGPPKRIDEAGPLEPVIKALLEPDPEQRIESADKVLERLDTLEGLDTSVMGAASTAVTARVADTIESPRPQAAWRYILLGAALATAGLAAYYAFVG